MSTANLVVLEQIERATSPEDLFPSSSDVKQRFRYLSHVVHPDHNDNSQRFNDAFVKLSRLYQEAISPASSQTVIKTKRHRIADIVPLSTNSIANIYTCAVDGTIGTLKIATTPDTNDLLENEYTTLTQLTATSAISTPGAKGFLSLIPKPVDRFNYSGRQSTAFATAPSQHTLADIPQHYPNGLDPKDMAWMWRRILDALGYVHSRSIIHGAVLPSHVALYPDQHHVLLNDFYAAVPFNSAHIPFTEKKFHALYPPEILNKEQPSPATDIYLSAATIMYMLGDRSSSLHPKLRGLLVSCLLPNQKQRPQDAWELRDDFTRLIEQLWGPRSFRPFHLT